MAKRRGSELTSSDPFVSSDELIRQVLLRELNKGLRSRAQLERLIVKHELDDVLGAAILDRYQEVGLIDDVAYARALINTRRKLKKLAKSAIRRELLTAGVAEADFEVALERLDQESELELATELALKRLRSVQNLEFSAQQRRISGYLARRGFGAGIISQAIRSARQQVN